MMKKMTTILKTMTKNQIEKIKYQILFKISNKKNI